MNNRLQTAEWIICDLRSLVSSFYSTDRIKFVCEVGFEGARRFFTLSVMVRGTEILTIKDESLEECFELAHAEVTRQAQEEHEIMQECQRRADRDDAERAQEERRCPL